MKNLLVLIGVLCGGVACHGQSPKFTSQTELRDTVVDRVSFSFSPIRKQVFDSHIANGQTLLHVSDDQKLASKVGDCVTIRLVNGTKKSLCDKMDGDNHQQYFIKGVWKPHDLLLLTYSDWEGGNDFFVNLKDESWFYVGDGYAASSDNKYLLSYGNVNMNPLATSDLLFARAGRNLIETMFKLQFEKITITNAAWIGANQCVLSTAAIEGIDEPIQPRYYLVTIN